MQQCFLPIGGIIMEQGFIQRKGFRHMYKVSHATVLPSYRGNHGTGFSSYTVGLFMKQGFIPKISLDCYLYVKMERPPPSFFYNSCYFIMKIKTYFMLSWVDQLSQDVEAGVPDLVLHVVVVRVVYPGLYINFSTLAIEVGAYRSRHRRRIKTE